MLFLHFPLRLLTKVIPSGKFLFTYGLAFKNLEGSALTVYFSSATRGSSHRPLMKMVTTQTSVGLMTHWYMTCPSSNSQGTWPALEGLVNPCAGHERRKRWIGLNGTGSWTAKFTHSTSWLFVVEKNSKTFLIVSCFIFFISVTVVSIQIWK